LGGKDRQIFMSSRTARAILGSLCFKNTIKREGERDWGGGRGEGGEGGEGEGKEGRGKGGKGEEGRGKGRRGGRVREGGREDRL
jgi:hypothetical protein